jgi:hypothetical protein
MFHTEHDVHRLLSVERVERLRADATDRPRRRGSLTPEKPRDRLSVARPAPVWKATS